VATDWRARMVIRSGFRLFSATGEHATAMRRVGLDLAGTLDDLLNEVDVVVDCTPKRVAAKNVEQYRRRGIMFIVQGGEKHEATGHSFVAESNFAAALDRDAKRVSCRATRRPSCGPLRRSSAPACFSVPEAPCGDARLIPGKAARAGS
jgi:glyceraldehyde-3-phosphate dehydrogenase (NAD(P))